MVPARILAKVLNHNSAKLKIVEPPGTSQMVFELPVFNPQEVPNIRTSATRSFVMLAYAMLLFKLLIWNLYRIHCSWIVCFCHCVAARRCYFVRLFGKAAAPSHWTPAGKRMKIRLQADPDVQSPEWPEGFIVNEDRMYALLSQKRLSQFSSVRPDHVKVILAFFEESYV